METLVANVAGKPRRVQKDGREWIVAPMVLARPGVMDGTSGPLYYPADELEKSAARWDNVPLVVGHPMAGKKALLVGGDYLAANGVGVVHNGRWERGKLRADGWFDVARLAEVEPRVLESLAAARPVALSASMTLSHPKQSEGGVFGGRRYDHATSDYRPDHVGVFAEGPTACTVQDGCGVLVSNALSHRALHGRLQALLEEKYPPPAIARAEAEMGLAPPYGPPWVVDVFDRYFVFCRDGDHYRLGYTTDLRTDAVALADEQPVEVALQTSYKPVSNQEGEQHMPLTPEQRREAVQLLVSNCNCSQNLPWKGITQQAAEGLDDATLSAYAAVQRGLASNAPAPQPAPPAPRPKTADEWVAETFPGLSLADVQGAIRHNLELQRQHKSALVERLTSNMAVGPDKEAAVQQLESMPAEALERLLPLADQQRRPVSNNYAGAAGQPPAGRAAHQDHLTPTAAKPSWAGANWR